MIFSLRRVCQCETSARLFNPLFWRCSISGGDLGFGRGEGTELVADQHARLASTPEQLSKEAFGCARVPTRLEQDIQHVAIGVDRPPEPMLLALDRDHDPFAHQAKACATDPGSKLPAEARDPVPHGLVGNGDPA